MLLSRFVPARAKMHGGVHLLNRKERDTNSDTRKTIIVSSKSENLKIGTRLMNFKENGFFVDLKRKINGCKSKGIEMQVSKVKGCEKCQWYEQMKNAGKVTL